MSSSKWNAVISGLVQKNVTFEDGLAAEEFASAEKLYDFVFPPDLREFLSLCLPVSEDFPNWRTGTIKWDNETTPIAETLDWPGRGMCFDIEKNGFWVRDWGLRPDDLQESFQLARKRVKQAPALIPIYGHRYLPAEPATSGNPVLSVHQTDIIYYGMDLASYFANEFEFPFANQGDESMSPRRIRFWSDIIDGANGIIYARRSRT
jgi:hypothetical protein